MSIEITKTPVLGLDVIQPSIFTDFRGEYTEVFNDEEISTECNMRYSSFVQDDVIFSKRRVLRGYHGDDRTWKYIMCLHGAFQIVVVDIDPQSPTFKKYDALVLDDVRRTCLLLPPKYVNAHQCLTGTCLFFYKQTTYYEGEKHQYGIRWDSIDGVEWGLTPILSERDVTRAKLIDNYVRDGKLLSPQEVNV